MKQTKCKKKVFVKSLSKFLPCIQNRHKGSHTADLTGELFGSIRVIKQGSPYTKSNGRNKVTWIISNRGFIGEVKAESLISGSNSGKNVMGGYGGQVPEYRTVWQHYRWIFTNDIKYRTYWGMPFYDKWNPKKGGSYQVGAKWIMENLGKRPGENYSLDIIKHDRGFVPGNLRWAQHKIQFLNTRWLKNLTNQQFLAEAIRRGLKLVSNGR
jgi:hypothetical protein